MKCINVTQNMQWISIKAGQTWGKNHVTSPLKYTEQINIGGWTTAGLHVIQKIISPKIYLRYLCLQYGESGICEPAEVMLFMSVLRVGFLRGVLFLADCIILTKFSW